MPYVEIVIKMPEEEYEHIVNREKFYSLDKSTQEWLNNKTLIRVIDGTLIPKGHGDLIDKSNLLTVSDIRSDGSEYTFVPYSEIEDAPIIIEANKESEVKE